MTVIDNSLLVHPDDGYERHLRQRVQETREQLETFETQLDERIRCSYKMRDDILMPFQEQEKNQEDCVKQRLGDLDAILREQEKAHADSIHNQAAEWLEARGKYEELVTNDPIRREAQKLLLKTGHQAADDIEKQIDERRQSRADRINTLEEEQAKSLAALSAARRAMVEQAQDRESQLDAAYGNLAASCGKADRVPFEDFRPKGAGPWTRFPLRRKSSTNEPSPNIGSSSKLTVLGDWCASAALGTLLGLSLVIAADVIQVSDIKNWISMESDGQSVLNPWPLLAFCLVGIPLYRILGIACRTIGETSTSILPASGKTGGIPDDTEVRIRYSYYAILLVCIFIGADASLHYAGISKVVTDAYRLNTQGVPWTLQFAAIGLTIFFSLPFVVYQFLAGAKIKEAKFRAATKDKRAGSASMSDPSLNLDETAKCRSEALQSELALIYAEAALQSARDIEGSPVVKAECSIRIDVNGALSDLDTRLSQDAKVEADLRSRFENNKRLEHARVVLDAAEINARQRAKGQVPLYGAITDRELPSVDIMELADKHYDRLQDRCQKDLVYQREKEKRVDISNLLAYHRQYVERMQLKIEAEYNYRIQQRTEAQKKLDEYLEQRSEPGNRPTQDQTGPRQPSGFWTWLFHWLRLRPSTAT